MRIGTNPLSWSDLKRLMGGESLALDPDAIVRIEESADYVRQVALSGESIYGVTTGFGANRNQVIPSKDAELLQENLIMSHACGLGPPLPERVVRTMMILRVNALAQGHSGICRSTLELLIAMVNAEIYPVVPELGSVGASGDLCPLAHMCLPIIGLGDVSYGGEQMPALDAFSDVGLSPVRLTYKEGLALLNGTQAMTAVGIVTCEKMEHYLHCADLIGAMSLEAVAGRVEALDPRIHTLRGRNGQIESAKRVRKFLAGSALAGAGPGSVEGKLEYVQDSYCLRCLPQVHGASADVVAHVTDVLTTESNAVTDNPIVFSDGVKGVLSGGNFHGEPVAMALDYLKLAIAELGNISERRSAKLTDKCFSEGLPPFLVSDPGLNSGMMIPQYVAAALVSENKALAHPASVDSIPTSANMEDHVSMGMHAAVHGMRMLSNLERILGIELLIAGQALELRRGFVLGHGTAKALDVLRRRVSFVSEDRVLHPDMENAADLLRSRDMAPVLQDVLAD